MAPGMKDSQAARQTGQYEELTNDKDVARAPKQNIDSSPYGSLRPPIPFCTSLKHPARHSASSDMSSATRADETIRSIG
jgi:hypothetical protein